MGLLSLFKSLFTTKVTLQFHDISCRYNGKQHVATFDVQGLLGHHSLELSSLPTFTHVTNEEITLSGGGYRIVNDDGKDVSRRYDVKVVPGVATIDPAELTISSASRIKKYDGFPLTENGVIIDGLISDESINVRTTGLITDVGSIANSIEIDWDNSSARREDYSTTLIPGELTVEPARLDLGCADAVIVYDGKHHGPHVEAPDGTTVEFDGPVEFKDAGNYSVAFTASKPNHIPSAGTAHLTIQPANLVVSSESASKVYDGTPLEAPTVTIDGLAQGETLVARAENNVTDVTTIQNLILIDWDASSALESNYNVEICPGILEIKAAPLEARGRSIHAVYNGLPHQFEIDAPPNTSIAFNGPAAHTDAGVYSVGFTASLDNHVSTAGTASITIEPAPLSIKSDNKVKLYDGNPLECPEVQIEGLVSGEQLVARATGTITDAGTVINDIDIDWNASPARQDNYAVKLLPGTLTVEPAPLDLRCDDTFIVYDGNQHEPNVEVPDGASLKFDGPSKFTYAGSYDIGFTATKPNYIPISHVAHLTITPAPLRISSPSASKQYDGTELAAQTLQIEGLASNESLAARATGRLVNVGSITNGIALDWENSNASRNNYDVSLEPGVLTITPATIEIQTAPKLAIYNGACHSFDIDAPEGAHVEYDSQESHIAVGSYRTGFKVSMPNHQTTKGVAELNIIENPDPVIIAAKGDEFEYDGMTHHATILKPQLPDGYHLVEARSLSKIVHVDESPVKATCDSLIIENFEGENVTDKLNIVYKDATLAVTPKPLYVFTFDARRAYTGKPLATGGRLSGLCDGETASFKVTGSRTTEGEEKNTYSLIFNGSAREADYRIIENLGRLTVLPPEAPLSPTRDYPSAPKVSRHPETPVPDGTAPTVSETLDAKDRPFHSEPPKSPKPSPISFPKNDFSQTDWPEIGWNKPRVNTIQNAPRLNVEQAATERKRSYSARTVNQRDNLDDAGLGRGYKPYDLDAPSLDSNRPLKNHLRDMEINATSCINSLLSANKDLLLYECFGDGIEDEALFIQAFCDLFTFFSYDQRLAIAYTYRHNTNSFVLLVALLARDCYDGKALWDCMFESIGLVLPDAQTKFKQMFISLMHQKGLVTYQREKNHTYIAYTAILHGGFSQAIWDDLWAHSFIPLAQDKALPLNSRGSVIVDAVLNHRSYMPHMLTTRNLLQKAPHTALSEPFEAALSTAHSVCDQWNRSEISFISTQELSSGALSSLGTYTRTERTPANKENKRGDMHIGSRADRKTQEKSKSIFATREMELSLDIGRGVAQLTWETQPAPSTMEGSKLELYVNGDLTHTVPFEPDLKGCSLPSGAIELKPHEQYDLELVIKKPVDDDAWQEIATLRQDFRKSKPYCFEFIQQRSGRYTYRKPNTTLINTCRIAYLVPSHIGIRGIRGMTLVNSIAAQDSWSQMTIYTYDVTAGAAGELFDERTGEVLSGWNESYRVSIDKTNVIGSIGNTDVYGHMLGIGETDVALPSITIDTLAKQAAEDVEVRFIREGKQSTLDAVLTLNDEDDSGSLALSFPSHELGRGVASSCIIEARQHSTEDLLLRYRFAIVPIQGFRLEDYKISPSTHELIGIYELSVTEPVTINYNIEEEVEREVESGAPSNVEAPLSLESVQTTLQDSRGASITFDLHLAGIEVQISDQLRSRSEQLPYVGYPSVKMLGFTAGDITVFAKGRRRGRQVKVKLGDIPIGSERHFDKAGRSTFNIFTDAELLAPIPGEPYISMPLTIQITFGRKMEHGDVKTCTATYKLLECGKGLEFTVCDIRTTSEGTRLCFDNKHQGSIPSCNMEIEFLDRRGTSISSVEVQKGIRTVHLPDAVRDLYDRRRDITASIALKSGFGIVDRSHSVRLLFNRARRNRSL